MPGEPIAVLDTSVLLNLATPVVDGRREAPTGDDPLRTVLSAYDVHVPATVLAEVTDASDGDDLLAAAADAVLRAAHHLSEHDVRAQLDEPLDYGLDAGEARAIVLANDLDADLFVTDEFGSTNFALVALEVVDSESLCTTPHLLCRLAEAGFLDESYVAGTLSYLQELNHWDAAYVDRLRRKYLDRGGADAPD